jgi:hypothetical protein
MKDQTHNYKDDECEARIVTACALRLDGYRYADEHGLVTGDQDCTRFVRGFLAEPYFDLPRGHLHCALFLLQKAYLKEDVLRWDSREARVIRELFLELRRDDVPEEYRNEDRWESWKRRHRPRLEKLLEFMRQRHEQTRYRDSNMDGNE